MDVCVCMETYKLKTGKVEIIMELLMAVSLIQQGTEICKCRVVEISGPWDQQLRP